MTLSAWESGQLPAPPVLRGWRRWVGPIGPGIVLAGTAIGSGEWLLGPAVTAHYGASLLWLAAMSILLQVFCNLMMLRYAVYCGESIVVGGLRTWPGPALWIPCYLILDVAALWPFSAANAAVPLAALVLGRIPEADDFLVKGLGYAIFLLAFVPLLFGGTIYRTIEKIMTVKLAAVLGYLLVVALLLVPASVWWEVTNGFFQVGQVPLRADTIVAGKHMYWTEYKGDAIYRLTGTVEEGEVTVVKFSVERAGETKDYKAGADLSEGLKATRDAMIEQAKKRSRPGRFFIRTREGNVTLSVEGAIESNGNWHGQRFGAVGGKPRKTYDDQFKELVDNHGLTTVNLIGYVGDHGTLPPLDWPLLAAFTALAGLGGLTNTLFSSYARDKGWGMGSHVGAIPSAVGGGPGLAHTGKVFPLDNANRLRWLDWMNFIRRDQMVWLAVSFVGLALPCMLALTFSRHTTADDQTIAALTADGMAAQYPDYRWLLWTMTLFCGFVILAPGQVSACDQIARRWTDVIWSASTRAKKLPPAKVKHVYYGILSVYALGGLLVLSLFNPLQITIVGAVLGNVALGFSALHALYVNRSLMPRELRPSWPLQAGVVCCGIFFLGISVVVVLSL